MAPRKKTKAAETGFAKFWKVLTEDRTPIEATKLTARQQVALFNLLATLLENGMPLQRAIKTLATDPSMKKARNILVRIHNRMEAGTTLHAAMAAFPKAFPENMIQQIKLGELSGNLPDSLLRLVDQIESWLKLRSSLVQKLSYPCLVIMAGSGLMGFMLTVVVPQFEDIYSESSVDLPWVTSVVTWASRTLLGNIWIPFLPIVGMFLLWIRIRTSEKSRFRFHKVLASIPLVGSVIRDLAALEFLRSVHSLSEAGFVPLDAFTNACSTVRNFHVRGHLESMANALRHGTKLSDALRAQSKFFPSAVQQMVLVGEHSGNITKACSGSCDFLQSRLQRRIDTAMGMIEPILTIGLATAIGWVVLAMYMPMFKMFDVLDY